MEPDFVLSDPSSKEVEAHEGAFQQQSNATPNILEGQTQYTIIY